MPRPNAHNINNNNWVIRQPQHMWNQFAHNEPDVAAAAQRALDNFNNLVPQPVMRRNDFDVEVAPLFDDPIIDHIIPPEDLLIQNVPVVEDYIPPEPEVIKEDVLSRLLKLQEKGIQSEELEDAIQEIVKLRNSATYDIGWKDGWDAGFEEGSRDD